MSIIRISTLQFKSAMSIPVDGPQHSVAKCHNANANSNVQWQACIIQRQQQKARVRRLRPAHFDRMWYVRYIHSATRYCKHENLLEGRGGVHTLDTHTHKVPHVALIRPLRVADAVIDNAVVTAPVPLRSSLCRTCAAQKESGARARCCNRAL